ncbi:MAG TPA: methyltransferase domain-containing protein [Puia sp.]|nr:methyltransferase domain-containing protein [Puia sp.]
MNSRLKSLLKALRLYYPLQGAYRATIFSVTKMRWMRQYAPYRGRGFCCNFCGALYERFVPEYPPPAIASGLRTNHVIAGYGENAYCPRCGSKNRERLVRAVIEDRLDFRDRRILHLSPERQLYRWLATRADVTTADLEPGLYRTVDRSVRQADATRLGFADASFDIVIANHVLEHIPDDAAAMKEFRRVLRPRGAAILQVPFSPTLPATLEDSRVTDPLERESMFGQRDHVRVYALTDYVKRLSAAGFRVQVLTPGELAVYRDFAIQEDEVVFLAWKP